MTDQYQIEEFPGKGIARPYWRVKLDDHVVASYAFDAWGGRGTTAAAAKH